MAFVLKTSKEGTQGGLMDEAKGGGLHCQGPDDTLSGVLHFNYLEASVMCWPPKQELKRTITGLGVAWAQGNSSYCCLSFVVVFSHSVVSDSLRSHGL